MAVNGMGGGAAQARMSPAQWAMKSKMNARQAADAAAGAQTWAGMQGAEDPVKANFLAHSAQGQQVVNQGMNNGTMSANYVNTLMAGNAPYVEGSGVHTPATGGTGFQGPLTGTPATGPAPGNFVGSTGTPAPHGDTSFGPAAGAMTQRDYLGSQEYNNGGGNNQVIRDWFTNHDQGGVGNPNQWGASGGTPPPPVPASGGGMASGQIQSTLPNPISIAPGTALPANHISGSMETGFPGASDLLSQTGSPLYSAPASNQMSTGTYQYQQPVTKTTNRIRTNPNQFRIN